MANNSSAARPTQNASAAGAVPSSASAAGTDSISISGTLDLTGSDNYASDGCTGCLGTDGYDDITSGAEVVVSDDTGKTLSITALDDGTDESTECDFDFVTTVPAGLGFYGIEVTHRGIVKFAEEEMSEPTLTIGD